MHVCGHIYIDRYIDTHTYIYRYRIIYACIYPISSHETQQFHGLRISPGGAGTSQPVDHQGSDPRLGPAVGLQGHGTLTTQHSWSRACHVEKPGEE